MAVITDNSSGAMLIPANGADAGSKSTDYGTWRGIGSSWFNAEKVAAEDFAREQQLIGQEQAFNANEAKKNRDWQEYMSNTSYQRAVDDMKAAGINPLLAYSNGGASTPSGASASQSSHNASRGGGNDSLGAVIGGLISTVGKAITPYNKGAGTIIQVVGKGVKSL